MRISTSKTGRLAMVTASGAFLMGFALLNGGSPLAAPKKTATGHRQRVRLLRAWCGDAITRALAERRALGCAADDVVDAFATLWTAERIHRGEATTLPADPPCDAHGLRMEIVV